MARFPDIPYDKKDDSNPSIQVFGRRFFKDQTPIEYLAEFLLVFASRKERGEDSQSFCFPIYDTIPSMVLSYYPQFRLGLKLLAFLGASKLETRHPVHIRSFRQGVEEITERSSVPYGLDSGAAVRLIQGLFSGFIGVAGDRTWTAHTFLPAATSLLAREVLWKHGGVGGAAKNLEYEDDWDDAWEYFNTSAHSFMARGGELLYLQLLNLFNSREVLDIGAVFEDFHKETYKHLNPLKSVDALRKSLQINLKQILKDGDRAIGPIGNFVDNALQHVGVTSELEEGQEKAAQLGWVPRETATEALLFAWEANNICNAQRGGLQKVALLRDLCVLHVMRSLCFQSARISNFGEVDGFVGGYSWAACSSTHDGNDNAKKIAINAYEAVETMLYRSLRVFKNYDVKPNDMDLDRGDDNVLKLFRKIGKQIGLIVPRKGQGMRITLPPHIVRLLVAALVQPGDRVRLDDFYKRIFAHYGLVINQLFMSKGMAVYGMQNDATTSGVDSSWFEEELRRGGYLIPLSDAVSLVVNPYKKGTS